MLKNCGRGPRPIRLCVEKTYLFHYDVIYIMPYHAILTIIKYDVVFS